MQLSSEVMVRTPINVRGASFNDKEADTFRRVDRWLDEVRNMDSAIPAYSLSLLLRIAANPGIHMRTLQVNEDMPSSTITVAIDRLSDRQRNGNPGLGLVIRMTDPEDARAKQCFLTSKGNRVLSRLIELLEIENR